MVLGGEVHVVVGERLFLGLPRRLGQDAALRDEHHVLKWQDIDFTCITVGLSIFLGCKNNLEGQDQLLYEFLTNLDLRSKTNSAVPSDLPLLS